MKSYRAYILANRSHTALSIGVTDDLPRRLSEHRSKTVDGFTKKYHTDRLVDYERTNDVRAAIARKKQRKHGGVRRRMR